MAEISQNLAPDLNTNAFLSTFYYQTSLPVLSRLGGGGRDEGERRRKRAAHNFLALRQATAQKIWYTVGYRGYGRPDIWLSKRSDIRENMLLCLYKQRTETFLPWKTHMGGGVFYYQEQNMNLWKVKDVLYDKNSLLTVKKKAWCPIFGHIGLPAANPIPVF